MTLKKVKTGDPMRISAETFNAMIDAAIDHRGGMKLGDGPLTTAEPSRDVLLVKNNGEQDINRFEPVRVEYGYYKPNPSLIPFVVSPADNLEDWQRQPVMNAKRWTPMTGWTGSWFYADHACVAIEPIAVGEMGRVLYRGLTPVWIDPDLDTTTSARLEWRIAACVFRPATPAICRSRLRIFTNAVGTFSSFSSGGNARGIDVPALLADCPARVNRSANQSRRSAANSAVSGIRADLPFLASSA